MKQTTVRLLLLICALFLPVRAGTYSFSFTTTTGNVTGTISGLLDLPFVGPGGSGSGAASSLILTSIPAGYGTLVPGNTVTGWPDQIANSFTVSNGTITSVQFFANWPAGQPRTEMCMNSTGTDIPFSSFTCFSEMNLLVAWAGGPGVPVGGQNMDGLAGITFQDTTVPEPGSMGLLCAAALVVAYRLRKRPGSSQISTT